MALLLLLLLAAGESSVPGWLGVGLGFVAVRSAPPLDVISPALGSACWWWWWAWSRSVDLDDLPKWKKKPDLEALSSAWRWWL